MEEKTCSFCRSKIDVAAVVCKNCQGHVGYHRLISVDNTALFQLKGGKGYQIAFGIIGAFAGIAPGVYFIGGGWGFLIGLFGGAMIGAGIVEATRDYNLKVRFTCPFCKKEEIYTSPQVDVIPNPVDVRCASCSKVLRIEITEPSI